MMQRESIQRYLKPILRVMVTASRKVWEREDIGILFW